MATVPQFWTRLVIFVDDAPSPTRPSPLLTPPSSVPSSISTSASSPSHTNFVPAIDAADIHSHVEWSAQLPIEVYVLRRRHSTSLGIDKTEGPRTRLVFEAIKPHLHRCHLLRFSVLQSSSLPSLVHDFAGVVAPILMDLRLECEVDDGGVGTACLPTVTGSSLPEPAAQASISLITTQKNCYHVSRENHSAPLPQFPKPRTGFWCPGLSAISLNGRNFRDLALVLKRQRQRHSVTEPQSECTFHMTLQHVEKVTIAHYSSAPEFRSDEAESELGSEVRGTEEGFRLEDLFEVVRREWMPKLEFLKLVDLDLSAVEDEQGEREQEVIELTPSYIHLEELASDAVRCFSKSSSELSSHSSRFRVRLVDEIEAFHVIRCSLPPPPCSPCHLPSPSPSPPPSPSSSHTFPFTIRSSSEWAIPDTRDLVLEEIDHLYGYSSPLRGWQGSRLVFTGCNGFDDEFLKMLRTPFIGSKPVTTTSTVTTETGGTMLFNAPNLQSIYLNDCNNYTVAELKSVIQVRNGMVLGSVVNRDEPPCIVELYVKGLRPEIGEEDRRWFEQRVRKFEWGSRRERRRRRG
ncbi:hypothetical protein D9756_008644 [Leucocoprinus leucothites]|uniref:Uncharacterized protein n=1 Tax=Leucocoprinus leucothites TaxID=201217 RepID=A0A8H5D0G2_9AGAR|nr:hypothetical protein D9756_008644 [Leucoagaricus leucothites]